MVKRYQDVRRWDVYDLLTFHVIANSAAVNIRLHVHLYTHVHAYLVHSRGRTAALGYALFQQYRYFPIVAQRVHVIYTSTSKVCKLPNLLILSTLGTRKKK